MKSLKILKAAAVSLACFGVLVPRAEALASVSKTSAEKTVKAPADLQLGKGGTLTGIVIDLQQKPIDGAVVSVRQGSKEVARTITDRKGHFQVKNLRGGVYEIVSAKGTGLYRAWAEKTAPPQARKSALVVSGAEVVRGQFGGLDIITLTTLGSALAAAILAGINHSDINDLEEQIEELQREIDRIPKSP